MQNSRNKKDMPKKHPQAKAKIGNKRARPMTNKSKAPPISFPVPATKRNATVRIVKQTKDTASFVIRQPFSQIANQVAISLDSCLVSNTLATASNPGIVGLCPQFINGAVQNESQFYSEYRIDSLSFHYTPTCPTTTSGALVFALTEQTISQSVADVTTFSLARALNKCVTTSVYSPLSWTFELDSEDKVFRLCEGAITGTFTDKLLYSKALVGKMDQAAAAVQINYGYLDIELGFSLRGLVPNQGIAMFCHDRSELHTMKAIRDQLFPKSLPLPVVEREEFDLRTFLVEKLHLGPSVPSSVSSWKTTGSR